MRAYLKADAIVGAVKVSLGDEILDRIEELFEGCALREACFEHCGGAAGEEGRSWRVVGGYRGRVGGGGREGRQSVRVVK